MFKFCKSALLAAITALFITIPLAVWAASGDYRFELSGQPEKTGTGTLVKVRLITLADGKPVPGAEIVETRLDMGPDGMAAMTAPVMTLASTAPGVFRFEARPTMAGDWGLSLSAKVPGESEPITGTITIPVTK